MGMSLAELMGDLISPPKPQVYQGSATLDLTLDDTLDFLAEEVRSLPAADEITEDEFLQALNQMPELIRAPIDPVNWSKDGF